MSKDTEAFKAGLQHESRAEIAKFQSALDRKQIEHQEQVRWRQVKRGDAIERVHEVFISALAAVRTAETDANLAVDFNFKDLYAPTIEEANDAVEEFHKALLSFGTFLTPDLVTSLDMCLQVFSRVVAGLRWLGMSFDPAHTMPAGDAEEAAAEIRKSAELLSVTAAKVLDEFRRAIEPEEADQPTAGKRLSP